VELLLLALLAAPRVVESPAAREQARLCEELAGEEGLLACRRALTLGLAPGRVGPVRELLARRLVARERWDELAAHLQEDMRRQPESAPFHFRLGSVLLFSLGRAEESLGPLLEAVRLDPAVAEYHVACALALSALGRPQEAAAAFEEALSLDPEVLSGRPAAREVREAARRGESWPR
jgi:tetratricopeptide (TPR) repeat protein